MFCVYYGLSQCVYHIYAKYLEEHDRADIVDQDQTVQRSSLIQVCSVVSHLIVDT